MAIPIQFQLFDAFLGEQSGVHSAILPDLFSTGGSKNLWIDKYGRARRIEGYAKQNSSPVVTNGGASATRVRALFPYRQTSGSSFTRQVIGVFDDGVDEWELWYSLDNGTTWTFIDDLGATPVGQIPDFTQFGTTLIITVPKLAPRQWDGTTLTVAGATRLPAPTVAEAGSGNLLGTYRWRVVPVKSDGTRKPASAASAATTVQNRQVTVSWTADSDPSVVGYEVYRTTGQGATYFWTSYVQGRTTTSYTDNHLDLFLLEQRLLQEHGDSPPSGVYFCEAHKQRVWYFRTEAFPQRGWWSDPGDPDSVYQDANFIEFKDATSMGDVIVGAVGDFEGQLVVFQERSIWTISGTGEVIGSLVDWTRVRTNAEVGAVHHRAVVRVPAGAQYTDQQGERRTTTAVTLAYLTPLRDIRLFDGDNDLVISHPVRTRLARLNYEARSKVIALHDAVRAEVAWLYPTGSASEPTEAVVWNYRFGVWYAREWGFSAAVEIESSTTSNLLLAGEASPTKGGFVYQLWKGTTFDGTPYRAQWMTKALLGLDQNGRPLLNQTKRWRWVDLLVDLEANTQITLEWLDGFALDDGAAVGSTTIIPAALTIRSANGDDLASATGDLLQTPQTSSLARALLQRSDGRPFHHEGLRLRVFDDGQVGGVWALEAKVLAYQVLPGIGRQHP